MRGPLRVERNAPIGRRAVGPCSAARLAQSAAAAASSVRAALRFSDSTGARGWQPHVRHLQRRAFAALTHTWELLELDPALSQRQLEVGPELVLALIQMRCDPSTVLAFAEQLETLRKPGPTINGRAVAELTQVPPHLRSHVISRLHVLTRLRGEEPELDSAKAIEAYLETACGGLLTRLCAEWWEDEDAGEGWEGQRLRAGYSKRGGERAGRRAARLVAHVVIGRPRIHRVIV